MAELIENLILWASANSGWIGVLVFLIAFAESLAIVGLLVPGVAMLFAAGALVGAGVLDFWLVYWWVVAGAALGDGLSFWLGRHYRYQLRGIWPFNRYVTLIDKGVLFFERWGGKSLVVGRFIGPVRAVVPLIAGMLDMPVWRFVTINVLAALLWAVAYLLPGIVVGASLELASQIAFHLVVMLLALLVLVWLVLWLTHRLALWLTPYSNKFLQALLTFSAGNTLPRRIAAALADPTHSEARGLSLMALVIVASTFVITAIATSLFDGGGFGHLDQLLYQYISSIRHPTVDGVMVLITTLGDGWLLAWVWLTVLVLLLLQHRPTAWHWLAALLYVIAVVLVLKYGLQIPRPPDAGPQEWSFPSAHTLGSTVIYGFLAVLLATRLAPEQRWPIYAGAIATVALIGFSRLYLGVHWFSDVLAGWVLGLLWVAILGLAWRHHQHPPLQVKPLVGGVVLALTLALSWHLTVRQPAQIAHYQPAVMTVALSAADWQAGAPLPLSRQTLVAREEMTLRSIAAPDAVVNLLQLQGWQVIPPADALTYLRYLSVDTALLDIPPLPKVYDGKAPTVKMLLMRDGQRYTLRLWQTRYRHQNCEVLVGHVMAEDVSVVAGLLLTVRSRITPASEALTMALAAELQSLEGADCAQPD